MSKYLVTGAAGFIGSTIAKKLLEKNHEVWTIDNLSTGFRENIPTGVKFLFGGCEDPKIIESLQYEKFDAILHIAGQSSGEISFSDPAYDLRCNTESTLRLIKYGLETKCKRFVYASSMSVYGEVEEKPIPETFYPRPLSFYGVGKLASENYMRIYQTKGLLPTALRFFNVYGPNQNMSNLKQGMVSIYLAQLIKNEKIVVKGDLDRFRDFVFIDDVVDFTIQIIDDKRSFGGVYNIATGKKTTVKELLDLMLSISRLKKEIDITEGTPGDQKGIFADISLIQNTFGFKPKFDLKTGLETMINWAKSTTW